MSLASLHHEACNQLMSIVTYNVVIRMMMYATIKYLAAVEHTSVGLTHACPNNSFHFTGHAAFSQRPRIPPTCPTYLADLMTECWHHDPKVH